MTRRKLCITSQTVGTTSTANTVAGRPGIRQEQSGKSKSGIPVRGMLCWNRPRRQRRILWQKWLLKRRTTNTLDMTRENGQPSMISFRNSHGRKILRRSAKQTARRVWPLSFGRQAVCLTSLRWRLFLGTLIRATLKKPLFRLVLQPIGRKSISKARIILVMAGSCYAPGIIRL